VLSKVERTLSLFDGAALDRMGVYSKCDVNPQPPSAIRLPYVNSILQVSYFHGTFPETT
jgi:hypothetical protein